ncbi:hypothetical protein N665_1342s0002 [Sinapis alba]|nr:hypothetical protein N665_1342s0002 [Sinapis alba]
MAVEDTPKPVVATEESKSNSVEHPIDRYHEKGDDAEDGEIVDGGEVDESSKSAVHESHPLEHSWTLWFDNPSVKSKQTTWGSSLRSVFTFSTVEEFWSLYNNLRHPSKLANGADLYCFKHSIEPKWEDPICANGGKWTMNFSRRSPISPGFTLCLH